MIITNNLKVAIHDTATVGLVQHGIGKIGAEVVNLSIGILIKICARLNICALNAPTSPIPKTLCAILANTLQTKNENNK